MSLYTITREEQLPLLKSIPGLHIEESTDLTLLSLMGEIAEEEVVKRMANDNYAFIAFVYGQPAAFGWMARGKARIGELNHEFILPLHQAYLWNFRTLPAFRGQGFYPALLQYILQWQEDKTERYWIIHAPENKASLKGISKAGFRYVGKLYARADGLAGFKPAAISEDEQAFITSMDFHITNEPAATCWNCNSPYMKKRVEPCCCVGTANDCMTHYQVN